MFWKRKKQIINKVPDPCIHRWTIVDVKSSYIHNGCDVDLEDYFIIKCRECSKSKAIDSYDLSRMRSLGLVDN